MLALTSNSIMRRVAGTECSGEEQQNNHETSCRNRMTAGELQGQVLLNARSGQEQNDHETSCRNRMLIGRATTGELQEQKAHGKSNRNRMTEGEVQGQVLLNARPDQEQNHHETSWRNRMLMGRATETEWPRGSCRNRMLMGRTKETEWSRGSSSDRSFRMLALIRNRMIKRPVEGTECSWAEL